MNLQQSQQLDALLIAKGWQPTYPFNTKTGALGKEPIGCIYPLPNDDHLCVRQCYTLSFSQKDFLKLYSKDNTADCGDWYVLMDNTLDFIADALNNRAKELEAQIESQLASLSA